MTNPQRIVIFANKIYDSAYNDEQVRIAIANCKMTHPGLTPVTKLAANYGGKLKA